MTSGIFSNNPVLALGLALPFAIVPTTSLKSGAAISLIVTAATALPTLLAPILWRKRPLWLRAVASVMSSMAAVMLASLLLRPWPLLMDSLGSYISLAAVNTLMFQMAVMEPRKCVSTALLDTLRMCLGFALVVCSVSALREILSSRTIWGVEWSLYPIGIDGVTLPYFGFILLGFLSALFRSLDRWIKRSMLARRESVQGGDAA